MPLGLTHISNNCEIYLGADSSYRDDLESLSLDCIITAEEYNALPEEEKKTTRSWWAGLNSEQ